MNNINNINIRKHLTFALKTTINTVVILSTVIALLYTWYWIIIGLSNAQIGLAQLPVTLLWCSAAYVLLTSVAIDYLLVWSWPVKPISLPISKPEPTRASLRYTDNEYVHATAGMSNIIKPTIN